jgi:pyruvate dehydrogenase E2 component (dihydrolipoamide acetyltransferase)
MADVTQVVMPQLGETVTEGTITRWLKQSGDEVAEDEDLFEVSTDKVDTTVPSAVSGVVIEILVPEGDTVEVGVPLALIGPAGSAATTTASGTTAAAAGDAAPSAAPPTLDTPALTATGVVTSPARADAAPADGPGPFLSPVVRRLVAEHQLDPASIVGSGAGGRITRDDVLAAVARDGDAPSVAPKAPAPVSGSRPAASNAARPSSSSDEIVPLSSIRKRIAAHLTESLHTAAHALVVMEVDYSCVDVARLQAKAAFRDAEGFGLTYLPFVARAAIDAIGSFPHLNASIDGDNLILHHDLHLGIAVDLDYQGLVVPVIHHADAKTIRAIARDIDDVAARARSSALTPDDIAGGTFTITNAGSYGTFITGPVINLPQVAILSTDGVKMRPVAVALDGGGYGVAVHPVGNLALSFDHRVFDGAYASAFLAAVVARLEDHDWSAELEAGAQHRAATPPADESAPQTPSDDPGGTSR